MHVACGRSSVLVLRRCDTLCTFGFVDNVMFSNNGPMAHPVHTYKSTTVPLSPKITIEH